MPAVAALGVLLWSQGAAAASPPQRLPSAVLIWPLIVVEGGGSITDTQVELVNLSSRQVLLGCIYVAGIQLQRIRFPGAADAQPTDLVAGEPRGVQQHSAPCRRSAPPASSSASSSPDEESVDAHNTIQGRAAVFGADGQTIGYSAVGFLRLTDGPLTNEISLDGVTYTQCPDEQHFVFIASEATRPFRRPRASW